MPTETADIAVVRKLLRLYKGTPATYLHSVVHMRAPMLQGVVVNGGDLAVRIGDAE